MQLLGAAEALYSPDFDGAMIDRSMFGDVPFAEMHNDCGNIENLDMDTYRMLQMSMQMMIFPPTLLIYIDVRPETAMERIRKRQKDTLPDDECQIEQKNMTKRRLKPAHQKP